MKAQLLAFGVTLLVAVAAHADTLVLKNGRRITGHLVGIAGSEIQFEDRSGRFRTTVRIPRDQVVRVEFGLTEGDAFDRERDRDGDRAGDRDRNGVVTGTPIPRGMRERPVVVVANERWIDTGIDLREGQSFYFDAGGEVRWAGRNRKAGPAGERNSDPNPLRPIPNRPYAALIGKIGEGQDIFFIGPDAGPFRARQSGRLYLGINDDFLADNSGNFRVNVSY